MGAGIPIAYDDEWIIDNWQETRNWLKLCESYNQIHRTNIKYNTFKSHCNRELALNYHYSDEQVSWLKENYPVLGRVKCAEAFNKKFNENKTAGAIKIACQKMGLRVTEERRKARAFENTGKTIHEIGKVVVGTHGEPYIKTVDGWIRLKNINYGEVPDGCIVIHLDGDQKNCNKENLVAIPRSISARMTKNKFWSENANITKTGVLCCTLEEIVNS